MALARASGGGVRRFVAWEALKAGATRLPVSEGGSDSQRRFTVANQGALRLLLCLLFVLVHTDNAQAHHNVGHGQTESQRTLTAMGVDPAPRQRASLITSAARSTSEPTLNTATTYSAALLVDLRLTRRFFAGVELPFVVVDEDATTDTKVGYGDTRLSLSFSLGKLGKKVPRKFTLGLGASFPTRTVKFESDPGNQWLLSPRFTYSERAGKLFWYALLQTPFESRPAGGALDVSPSLGLGVTLFSSLRFSGGLSADIRALSTCQTVDGSEVCSSGRATEVNRPMGAFRAYGQLSAAYDFSKTWSLFSSGLLPLTSKKDVEWVASLGAEARF